MMLFDLMSISPQLQLSNPTSHDFHLQPNPTQPTTIKQQATMSPSEITDLKKAEQVAQSDGGPKTDRATAMRNKAYDADKMENELEMHKANKTKVSSAEEVGGRKGKGTLTGVLEKITPDNREKEIPTG
ncbi:hypothetical protein BDY17DRAFT_60243 [Neohortaea acidophila]|uniref:Uncharacterized protein n=1 Tax=Neohortaea acidophila TaxID=245834 RepID=A0A6A6PGI3_9PEZI|nr:uncharacterized protein BDY17DRAFT_60243 [Neohortaea acidophila]KAF2478834.1 hypothetical protein BDY17DRAFT_60243 [Neohortaea acidophila]